MKVVVKSFSKSVEEFANVDSWSDKELANKLNEVLKNPKNPDAKSSEAKKIASELGLKADSMKSLYQAIKADKSIREKFLSEVDETKGVSLGSPEKYWRGEKSSDGPGAPNDYKVLITPSGFSTSTGTKCKINNTVKKATEALTGLEYCLDCNTRISIRDWGRGASVTVTMLDSSKRNPSAQIHLQEYSKDSELNVFAPDSDHKFSFKSPGSINKRIAWDEFYKIMRPFFSELFKMQF